MAPCPLAQLVGRPICPKLKFSTPLAGHLYYHNASEYYSWEPDACVLRRLTGEQARSCLADVMSHGGTGAEFAYTHNRSAGLETAHVRLSSMRAGEDGAAAGASDSSGAATVRRDVRNSGVLRTGSEEAPSPPPTAELLYSFISKGDPSTVEAALDWVSSQTNRPPLVILNACAHYHDMSDWEYSKPVKETLRWWSKRRQRMGKQAGALIWRSCTTPTKSILGQVDEEEAKISHAAKKAGVPVFAVREVAAASWRQHVAATLAPTSVHFYQFLYESFNDVLLNVLCPSRE
ncbi:hypothetical protein HYH03_001419 [Edaphochlamys debaryana]|uniref:Uncharacterized protein n=1 Tax=Edaphochlamys debaryana TaxID=47281 RepID=A0A836C6F4_9CHLO|nr:hypothetical protein HYH03_001419 [Edaphochlamys debaryana]|eukprot:KAG2500652.1 hypothetical protein HYH03_001419 [Edaphochlamys debaryana]